jgi:hypothetical protein
LNVLNVLQLLVRCVRHSAELAEAVAECPRLLHTLQKVMLLPAAAEDAGGRGTTHGARRERQCVQVRRTHLPIPNEPPWY